MDIETKYSMIYISGLIYSRLPTVKLELFLQVLKSFKLQILLIFLFDQLR